MPLRGGNPFAEDTSTTVSYAGTPRIRVTDISPSEVTLVLEIVNDEGDAVLTFNRTALRLGGTMKLNNISMHISVETEEKL